jgi:lipid A 3-O-deacylase
LAGRFGRFLAVANSLALVLSVLNGAYAADLPSTTAAPPPAPVPVPLYDPTKFEVRGGFLAESWGPDSGNVDVNGELVFPKLFTVPGWEDMLIPRLHVGGFGSLEGKTSYGYAGALWTVNYDRYFAEAFLGGAVHNGPLISSRADEPSYGCRYLYHVGANVGYRFDEHWSAMVTFDHASDGRPTLSNCPKNTGLSLVGVRLGYAF